MTLKRHTQTYNKQQIPIQGKRGMAKIEVSINEENGYMEDTLPFTT